MNEELVEKTQLAMVEMIESIVKAKDFAVDQAPEVVSQLLAYNTLLYASWSALWVACIILSAWGLWKFIALVKDDDDWIPGVVFTVVCLVVSLCALIETTFNGWIKIWLAPKVWLLEYAANLVG